MGSAHSAALAADKGSFSFAQKPEHLIECLASDQAAPDSGADGIAVASTASHLSIESLNTATIVGAPTGLIPVICPPSKSTISMPPFTRPDQPISGSGPY